MATREMIASVRLTADTGQYTAEILKAGRVAESYAAQVSSSAQGAANSVQSVGASLGTTGSQASKLDAIPAALDKTTVAAKQAAAATAESVKAVGTSLGVTASQAAKVDAIPVALDKTTISAKQTAAALRGVPAQFTDIVTSLQGGQSPLTVFIQQGGQLKDMFGGAGNAARAMGGYVAGLATVTTVASTVIGGAVVGLALAYNQGSKEADAYVRSIVMTGNAAGTTVGQLQALAGTVSTAANVTKGASAEALAALVGDGNTAAAMLERAAGTAVVLQRDAGIAVSETVKRFSELGKEPVAATIKLNEQYHYLTTAVYEQIKALDEQGKKEEAAALAQKTFSDAMDYRAGQLRANLGTIERAWAGVTSAAGKAWDAMLDVGRKSSPDAQLAELQQQIAEREKRLSTGFGETGGGAATGRASSANVERLQSEITSLRAKAAALAGVTSAQNANASQEAASAKQVQARTAFDKEGEKYLSKKAQMEREITAARNEGAAAGATQAEIETRLGQIREKYKEKGTSTPAGQSELANLRARTLAEQQYVDQLKAHGEQAVKVSEGDKLVLQYQEQLKGKLDAKTRSAKEALLVEAQNLAAVQKVRDVEVERQKALATSTATHEKLIEANYKSADSIREQAEKQEAANAVLGKGKTAIEQMTLATLQHQLQEAEGSDSFDPKYIASLNAKVAAQSRFVAALNNPDFKSLIAKEQEWLDQAKERSALYEDEKQLAGLTNLERAKIVATRQVELRLAKELAEIDKSGIADAQKEAARLKAREAAEIDSSAAVNKVVQDDWSKTADQINQSLTDALMTGGKDGADYIEGLFRTMVLRPLISATMAPVSNLVNQGMNAIGLGSGSSTGIGSILNTGSNIASLFGGNSVGNLVGSGLGWLTGATAANTAIGTGLGLGAASSGAAASAAAAAGGTTMMGTLGAAMPYVGLALAAVSLLKGVGKGESRSGGQYGVAFDGAVTNNRRGETYTQIGQQFNRNNSTGVAMTTGKAYLMEADGVGANDAKVKAALEGTAAGINSMLKGMGSSVALAQFFGGFETSGKGRGGVMSGGKFADGTTFGESGTGDNYAGTFYERFSTTSPDLETAIANFSQDLLQSSIQALQKVADAPQSIKRKLNGVDAESLSSEDAQTLLTDIGNTIAGVENFRAAVKSLPFDNLRSLSFDAAAGLIELSGGIDNLGTKLGSYYNNFYSESERQANALKAVQGAMSDLGYASVDTRAEYRALYESQNVNTEAGRVMVAQLLQLESAFAAAYPDVGSLADAIDRLRNPVRSLDDIAKNIVSMEDKAWALENEGNTAAIRARELAGLTATEQAIQLHIYALEDQKTAATEVANAAADAASAQRDYVDALASAGGGIASLVRELTATQGGNADPMALMRQRQSDYLADMALARQGDIDASVRVAQSARDYIDASQGVSTNATQAAINAQVISELKALPATKTYEQLQLAQLATIAELTAQQLSAQNIANTLLTNFGAIDLNIDGFLTFTELQTALAGKASDAELRALFALMDVNGDGTISQLELVRNNTLAGAQAGQTLNAEYIGQSLSLLQRTAEQLATVAQVIRDGDRVEADKLSYLSFLAEYTARQGTGVEPMYVRSLSWSGSPGAPITRFAQGGVFTNSIVDRATNFSMGQMGEAGPEAIMPLERGPGGDLGVRMYGRGPYASLDFADMSNALASMATQLAKVSAELAEIKRGVHATAAHTADTKDGVRTLNRDGLQVWNDPKEPLSTKTEEVVEA